MSLFTNAWTPTSAMTLAIISILVLSVYLIMHITKFSLFKLFSKLCNTLIKVFGKFINKCETNYSRDLKIGKINEKCKRVKSYRFLNELIIDLGIKQDGITPYGFLFIVMVLTFLGTLVIAESLFGSVLMLIFLYPILLCGVICMIYTKANLAHDRRIEAIIEAENIICNNISNGVTVAIKEGINVIPIEVRGEFEDFIDNLDSKNLHIRTALLELNNNLGTVANDFIRKCIVFETEEEHGMVGVFRDVVEVNTIKMKMRVEMKRRFEEAKWQFIIGAGMIFIFLAFVILVFDNVRVFYFTNVIGQVLLAIDLLLLIIEFVYITYLRAQEL